MKLLFVHGTKIKEDKKGNLYTDGSYNEEVWNRYLSISSEFSIIARKDPTIYDIDYAQNKFNYLDNDKIEFIEVPNRVSSIQSFFDFRKYKEINKIIKEQVKKCDHLIARLPGSYSNIAIKYAKTFQKPYLTEVVGCAWDSLWNHSMKGRVLALNSYLQMKKSVRDAPFSIYVTNQFLQKRYPTHGESISCSNVALQEFDDKILINRLNKIRNRGKNDNIIIGTTAAVDVRYKGQQYVIHALGKLKKRGIINFKYQLVGGGDQSYLKSIAKKYGVIDQIEFLGAMPYGKVINWLDNIDIYIQPSLTEGLPRALIEAMSRGVPAIGSGAGGIPELLDDKYIVRNISKNVDDISGILESINKKSMEIQAKRNFEESKKYDRERIEKRRMKFLIKFKEDV